MRSDDGLVAMLAIIKEVQSLFVGCWKYWWPITVVVWMQINMRRTTMYFYTRRSRWLWLWFHFSKPVQVDGTDQGQEHVISSWTHRQTGSPHVQHVSLKELISLRLPVVMKRTRWRLSAQMKASLRWPRGWRLRSYAQISCESEFLG